MQFALKSSSSYTLVLLLVASCIPLAEADSFMDKWLAGGTKAQKAKSQGGWLEEQASQVASKVASQVASSSASSFDEDAWLTRQHEADADSSPEAGGQEDDSFSQAAWTPAASWEADDDLEQSLLSEIEEELGLDYRRSMEARMVTIEEGMRPMFQALPKNEYDKLGHPSVRYILHRFFVQEHGWFIEGLFTEGAALNTSSPSRTLKDRVPMFVEGLFERRLGGRGFDIHDVAVLVAVVENSVHQEAQLSLKATFKTIGLSPTTSFGVEQVDLLIQIYMSGFVMNTNMSSVSASELNQQVNTIESMYPTWPRAKEFFLQVRLSQAPDKVTFSFAEISAIVRQLVDTFGTFQGKQCQGLKSSLTALERKGSSGCVNLPDFYEKGLKADSNWLFVESPEFLGQIGVLDETDPKNPRLLSANYINSPTNCLAPTGYYMVCCHNECDDILGRLEGQLAKPAATPQEIMTALRTTSSSASSLRAGQLAIGLRQRLQEVADHHDGRVPIHGRLFAQWLHHVFPHECQYPHLSGSKHPQWVEDFEEETGKFVQMTDEQMVSFVANASNTVALKANLLSTDVGSCAPWQAEEELFASIPHARPLHELENDPHVWNVSAAIAFLAAAFTLLITMLRSCKSISKLRPESKMLQI